MTHAVAEPIPVMLSIVVAALDSAPDVRPCLDAVRTQVAGRSVEVLLVANPAHPSARHVADAMPGITLLTAAAPGLVPDLWALGMARAQGHIVAVTISGCVPAPGWVDAMLAAHESADAAIGGPIVQATPASLGDWAVCFARYGAYLPPLAHARTVEVPGDNGSYKRDAIAKDMASIARTGFWEVEVNAALRARGATLAMHPAMAVRHTHSYGAGAFCRQRWIHGRRFGAERRGALGAADRLARVAAVPVTLAVMIARAARHARRAGLGSRFLRASPLVALFYACWLAGESAGLLSRPR